MTIEDHPPASPTPTEQIPAREVRLEPLGDNVILVDWEASELDASAEQGNICHGTVYATGAKVPEAMRVPDGHRVVYQRHSGAVVEHAGVRYLVLYCNAILAVWREYPIRETAPLVMVVGATS